jgi:hypothetical protein
MDIQDIKSLYSFIKLGIHEIDGYEILDDAPVAEEPEDYSVALYRQGNNLILWVQGVNGYCESTCIDDELFEKFNNKIAHADYLGDLYLSPEGYKWLLDKLELMKEGYLCF